MKTLLTLAAVALIALAEGCADTEYRPFEAKSNMFEGKVAGKVVVDGMEIWDNGDPPRKYKVLGIIDDERPGGDVSMSQIRGDMVKRAREIGGDAVVQISSQSQIAGHYTSGTSTAYTSRSSATAYEASITMPVRRNVAKFAVIKYLD